MKRRVFMNFPVEKDNHSIDVQKEECAND